MAAPRRVGAMLGVLAVLLTAAAAHAQTVAGGLTALPPTNLGPNLLHNAGFEILTGGLPAPWSAGTGWSADQLVMRAGAVSYRRTTGAGTSSQTLQLKTGTYLVSAWIKTEGLGSGSSSGVRLQLDFRPGGINAWTPSAVISGTNDWKLYQIGPVVVDSDRTAAVKLENYNGASGTAWFDDVQLVQILPRPVSAFLLYPNYRGMLFDDQPQTIQLDVTVTPPGGDFGRYSVRAVLTDEASGQLVKQQSLAAAANLVATLDGSTMQTGRGYLATVSLVETATGTLVSSYPAYRVSKVAGSARQAMNVSFDASNRVLLKGIPRFILGVYDSGMGYSAQDSFWENALWSPTGERRMDGLKVNMYLNYWYGEAPLDAMNALMANLQRRGVTYLQTGNCFDTHPAGMQFGINNSDAYVEQLGAHPGSAGYYTIDECVSTMVPGAFTQYDRLRRLDPDSVTFSANFGTSELLLWRDAADIISTDPYPLYAAEPTGGYNHRTVAEWTALSRNVVKDARPIMTVLQFFKFTSLGRWPTLTEMRNHAYMAIVEGARGLWWWSLGDHALKAVCSGWCTEKTAHMEDLKRVVNEIAALEPVLLADDAPGALTGTSNPNIKTKVKVVGGRGYVFAYSNVATPQSATFTWRTAPGTVTVNAEDRTIGAAGATFTDTFGPFQAHVYVLDDGVSPLTASFTRPTANQTVSGAATVTVAASGGSGGGYTYTIAVDGATISTGAASSITWDTTTVPSNVVALTATVTDAAGGTVSVSQSVTVSNPPVNVAARSNGGLASSSSTYSGAYPVDAANDGDRRGVTWGQGGGWNDATPNVFPDWLQVTFSGPKIITAIDVFTLQDNLVAPVEPTPTMTFKHYGITAFQVQYWTGANWATVPGASVSGNISVWRRFTFSPLTTDRVRILVSGASASYSRITEVQAWSLSGPPSEAPPSTPQNTPPVVSLIAPTPGAALTPPANITLTASAVDTDGTITKVEFFHGSIKIGEALTAPYSIVWGQVAAGTYSLTARATDNTGASSSSAAVNVTVGTLVNVAAQANGGSASASSTYNLAYGSAGANDGDRTGWRWGNGGGWNDGTINLIPDVLQITFNGPKTISEVDVFTLQDNYVAGVQPTETMTFRLYGITAFEVQYWTGTAWASVPGGVITGNTRVWRRLTFAALSTDRIRVLVRGALARYSRIVEVEAWGK